MSINVCRPLKRAKSTVGEPLVNCTVLPFWSVAEMLTCTLNEMTLAIGASVPTTNEEPVTVCELGVVGGGLCCYRSLLPEEWQPSKQKETEGCAFLTLN